MHGERVVRLVGADLFISCSPGDRWCRAAQQKIPDREVARYFSVRIFPRPAAADLKSGVKRHGKLIMLACFFGMPHHDLANLLGELWPAADDELIVNPQREDAIAVPAVAEPRAQFVMDVDQPSFANDRLGAGYDPIK